MPALVVSNVKSWYGLYMEKYLVVKVYDSDRNSLFPEVVDPATTNMGVVRKAIHDLGKDRGIHIADMPTHARLADHHPAFFTTEESEEIAKIFETALRRAKDYYNLIK